MTYWLKNGQDRLKFVTLLYFICFIKEKISINMSDIMSLRQQKTNNNDKKITMNSLLQTKLSEPIFKIV